MKKKVLPLTLVLIGAALLITAVVFWIDSSTSTEKQGLGKTLLDWVTLVTGLGASIKGWIDLFKKEKLSRSELQTSGLQLAVSTTSQNAPEIRLPEKRYSRLVGRETEIKECLDVLRNPNEKQLIGLIGMGGAGKSALAREVIERVRSENLFSSFLWLTAKQQTLDALDETSLEAQVSYETLLNRLIAWLGLSSQLRDEKDFSNRETSVRKSLKHLSVLVVLDNLETALDQEQIVQKFSSLFKNTSCRIILTSREEWKFTRSGIKQIPLAGLQESDALALMREVTNDNMSKRGLTASEGSLRKIARAVGYMPLALKISVGLLDNLDLQVLLDDLEKLHSEQIKSMYDYLFANTWRTLAESQKKVLVAISTFDEDEGVSARHLRRTKVVLENEFADAIERLAQVSVIEVVGNVESTRYTLHPLTLNFIRLQVA